MKNDVFSEEELILFTEKLMNQNSNLFKLLQKIDFSGLLGKQTLPVIKTIKKCKADRG